MGFFSTLAQQVQDQLATGISSQVENRIDEVIRDNNPLNKFDINLGTGRIKSDFMVDEFVGNFNAHREVSKADKFNVVITIPDVLSNRQSNEWSTERELTLQCEVAEFPGRDINMIEYRHYGFIRRIPHSNQYGIASFTFYCAGDMHEKKFFDSWLDNMLPTKTGFVIYPEKDDGTKIYETPISINQYDSMGSLVYECKLFDAVPTSVSQLNLDWNNDSVHRLTVTFAFRKWFSPGTDHIGADKALIEDVDPSQANDNESDELSEIKIDQRADFHGEINNVLGGN